MLPIPEVKSDSITQLKTYQYYQESYQLPEKPDRESRKHQRMRWQAFFFKHNDQDNKEATNNNNFGFKSRKCPPQNSELDKFEGDLLGMVHNIKFRNVNNKFQKTQQRHQQN